MSGKFPDNQDKISHINIACFTYSLIRSLHTLLYLIFFGSQASKTEQDQFCHYFSSLRMMQISNSAFFLPPLANHLIICDYCEYRKISISGNMSRINEVVI